VGKKSLIDKIWKKMVRFGGSMDPHQAFLLERGLKTFALRVKHHNENGEKLASEAVIGAIRGKRIQIVTQPLRLTFSNVFLSSKHFLTQEVNHWDGFILGPRNSKDAVKYDKAE